MRRCCPASRHSATRWFHRWPAIRSSVSCHEFCFHGDLLYSKNGGQPRRHEGTKKCKKGEFETLEHFSSCLRVFAVICSLEVHLAIRAFSSITFSSTLQPAARSSALAFSISLWLMPPSHGTKIMLVGATLAM